MRLRPAEPGTGIAFVIVLASVAQGFGTRCSHEDLSWSSTWDTVLIPGRCEALDFECSDTWTVLGQQEAEAIASAVKQHVNLTDISLEHCGMGDMGAEVFAQVLSQTNSTLEQVSLRGNQISAKGAKVLARSLASAGTLKSLNLGGNGIGDEGASAIGESLVHNTRLEVLQLQSNNITWQGAVAFSAGLAKNRVLQNLSLSLNPITFHAGAAIGEAVAASALRGLRLAMTDLGDPGIFGLARAFADSRAPVPLQALDLFRNKLSSASIVALNDFLVRPTCRLSTLELDSNKIADPGALAMAETLASVPTVRLAKLVLSDNLVTDAGAGALLRILQRCGALRYLALDENAQVTKELLTQITAEIERCQEKPPIEFTEPPLPEQCSSSGGGGLGKMRREWQVAASSALRLAQETIRLNKNAVEWASTAASTQDVFDSAQLVTPILLGMCTLLAIFIFSYSDTARQDPQQLEQAKPQSPIRSSPISPAADRPARASRLRPLARSPIKRRPAAGTQGGVLPVVQASG